ncbi:MAG: MopE-related protein, partial [Myxococcales bacterium]|nr:MopE-related protein [Myxococcales bacterium]
MRPTKNPAQAETRGRPAGGEDRRGRRAELGGGLPALLGLGILLLSGCGASPPPGADAGGADAGPCAVDLECEDGLFCNGPERCAPGAPGASARGCLPASEPPCMPSQICDEEAASCLSQCDREPDADGDGARSVRCGGSDCDDADSSRHPGAIEICDAEGHDEDCDPSTLGPDEDGDGYAPGACCFLDPLTHTLFCGADCDDRSAEINPEAPESCNGADDNCDGRIDEEVSTLYYPDCDRDGFGQPGPGTSACATPSIAPVACEGIAGSSWSPRPTDCEDRNPAMHPGAAERCNDADDDCDGEVDEAGAELSCRLPGATLMRCAAGSCEVLSCAADLEDCDGIHSNGCESALLTSPDHCGSCGTVCAVAHGISTCVEGVCATAICEPGYHRCEQACVSNASLETCGEQCAPCPLAPRRGLGTSCDGLRCGVICAAGGYEAFGEGTESPECLWNDPTLASLVVSTGTLEPLGGGAAGFDPSILDHQIREILGVPSLALAPTSLAPDPSVDVILRVDGEAVPWGVFSAPIPLSLGWNVIQIEVLTDGGASRTYRLHVRRGVPAAAGSLRPASAQLGDLVGRSIAISGDTLVIGDAGEDGGSRGLGGDPLDDSALQSGAAYVFVWDSASQRWMEQAYLKASNADANDDFGADVAIEGDTIVIGAPGEASTARGVGGD